MTSQLHTSRSSGDEGKDAELKKERPYKIFFKDLFLFKENEIDARKKERMRNHSMKIYQKTTFSSRMKSRSHLGQLAFFAEAGGSSYERLGLDPTLILRLTEGADRKRTVHEFINDQRDRFLLEYAVSTKKNTIKRFERLIAMKENQLKKAEKKLQDDAMSFEEFLRENDQRSVDALKMAAQETINKLQMTSELKKASMEVQSIKSEIAKTEFLLKEYMKYGFFLLKLSPKQWQLQQSQKRAQSSKSNHILPKILEKFSISTSKKDNSTDSDRMSLSEDRSSKKGSQGGRHRKSTLGHDSRKSSVFGRPESMASEDSLEYFLEDEIVEFDLLPEIYFKEPEELLQVLTELEEQNLTLVQYSQDVDENLEDVNKREKFIQDKINNSITFLLEHKHMLRVNCEREEEKAAELELRSRLFSFGQFNSDAQRQATLRQETSWKSIYFAEKFIEFLLVNIRQPVVKTDAPFRLPKYIIYQLKRLQNQVKHRSGEDKLIDSLSRKINQVYKVCIGDAEVGGLNAIQKLVKVESRLVELSDLIESIPKESVEAIERIKQKERRQKLREEKLKEKQRHQEERLKAALQRAVAQPKKKLGRRLIYRSKPQSANKRELLLVGDTRSKLLEEEYFFS
ncbi:coiled-coil domain-containing protein 38 isoform X2 [Mastomys coucha]|uniref:coiled-coil domain-containing protein 38 isoform X2 n=1 Tax=Mastomys coucha TaxID=35658 RepID=UPI00126243AF|nr:coiled-coil domain-containing protein 38 isoform X2 [Mastomys coucha]